MPTSTDLVTDLPADFEVFGQAVDTSLADLKGGTSGQILSKASGTDMDFTWITNDVGDITGVTATSPLTGGGTSGAITVGIQSATTGQSGAVQLTDSTSSTSTTTAATPNSVKTSYDLANAAIPKSTVTTNGDVIYATGSATVTRLGIGSTGQVLTVSGGVPSWATASSGAFTKITSGSFSASSAINVNSCFSSTYMNYKLIVNFTSADANRDVKLRLRVSGTDASGSNYSFGSQGMRSDGVNTFNTSANNATSFDFARANSGNKVSSSFEFFRPFEASPTVIQGKYAGDDNTSPFFNDLGGLHTLSTSYDGFTIFPTAGNISGNYYVYGYSN